MGNLPQKSPQVIAVCLLVSVGLLTVGVECQEREEPHISENADQDTCIVIELFVVSNQTYDQTEGWVLLHSTTYTGEEANAVVLNDSRLSSIELSSSFRLPLFNKTVYVLPRNGGVLLLDYVYNPVNNSYSYQGYATPILPNDIDCTFKEFLKAPIGSAVLGLCSSPSTFYPLTVVVDFANLTRSHIKYLAHHSELALFGVVSNFVTVDNRCLTGERPHVLFMYDGFILDFNIESGIYTSYDVIGQFPSCQNVTKLELISPDKLVAYCVQQTISISVCELSDDPSRYVTVFSKMEFGEVYFCSDTEFISVKNNMLTLRSVANREQVTNSTYFPSEGIVRASCRVRENEVHFVASLASGETWYCDINNRDCQLLGASTHAVNVPSVFLGDQYVIVNNDTHTLVYDLSCPANPIVTQLGLNFDIANFYESSSTASCQCALPTTASPLTDSTDSPSTTATTTGEHSNTTQQTVSEATSTTDRSSQTSTPPQPTAQTPAYTETEATTPHGNTTDTEDSTTGFQEQSTTQETIPTVQPVPEFIDRKRPIYIALGVLGGIVMLSLLFFVGVLIWIVLLRKGRRGDYNPPQEIELLESTGGISSSGYVHKFTDVGYPSSSNPRSPIQGYKDELAPHSVSVIYGVSDPTQHLGGVLDSAHDCDRQGQVNIIPAVQESASDIALGQVSYIEKELLKQQQSQEDVDNGVGRPRPESTAFDQVDIPDDLNSQVADVTVCLEPVIGSIVSPYVNIQPDKQQSQNYEVNANAIVQSRVDEDPRRTSIVPGGIVSPSTVPHEVIINEHERQVAPARRERFDRYMKDGNNQGPDLFADNVHIPSEQDHLESNISVYAGEILPPDNERNNCSPHSVSDPTQENASNLISSPVFGSTQDNLSPYVIIQPDEEQSQQDLRTELVGGTPIVSPNKQHVETNIDHIPRDIPDSGEGRISTNIPQVSGEDSNSETLTTEDVHIGNSSSQSADLEDQTAIAGAAELSASQSNQTRATEYDEVVPQLKLHEPEPRAQGGGNGPSSVLNSDDTKRLDSFLLQEFANDKNSTVLLSGQQGTKSSFHVLLPTASGKNQSSEEEDIMPDNEDLAQMNGLQMNVPNPSFESADGGASQCSSDPNSSHSHSEEVLPSDDSRQPVQTGSTNCTVVQHSSLNDYHNVLAESFSVLNRFHPSGPTIQPQQAADGAGESGRLTDGYDVFKVFQGCWRNMRRVVSQYYKVAENISHIPFIDPVTVVVCDHHGIEHTLVNHGITLKIPEGAIPKGRMIHMELAVALYGPFNFPNNTRPISPILWLCPQEDIEFNKPIQVTLPHFLTGLSQLELEQLGVQFVKANHNNKASVNFQTLSNRTTFTRTEKQDFGTLETTHCCLICITARQCPELARKKGHRFSRIDCISSSSTYVVNFCVTFYLPSCLQMLNKQFPLPMDMRHSRFKFEESGDGSEPHLKIVIQDHSLNQYLVDVYPKNSEIMMSDVDFWAKRYTEEDMKLDQDSGLYPPRVTVNWAPVNGYFFCIVPVVVNGSIGENSLNTDVILPLVSRTPTTSLMLANDCHNGVSCEPSDVLTERDHLKICGYLQPMPNRDIIRLGQALGLLRSNLKKMNSVTLPDEMVDAWLIKADHVLETSGWPTWMSLYEALKKTSHPGIAAKIKRQEVDGDQGQVLPAQNQELLTQIPEACTSLAEEAS